MNEERLARVAEQALDVGTSGYAEGDAKGRFSVCVFTILEMPEYGECENEEKRYCEREKTNSTSIPPPRSVLSWGYCTSEVSLGDRGWGL
jgi:hypothetical protein